MQLHEIERIHAVPQVRYESQQYCWIRIERKPRHPGERAWRRRITGGSLVPHREAAALARAMGESVGLTTS